MCLDSSTSHFKKKNISNMPLSLFSNSDIVVYLKIKGLKMKKVLLVLITLSALLSAGTAITTCDSDGRNCVTTYID